MEEDNINFLQKPNIDYGKLNYIIDIKNIYVNLYEFNTKKDLQLYKYPFSITPEIEPSMAKIKQIIINKSQSNMKQIYGIFIHSGDSLFSMNKIETNHIFKSEYYSKGRHEYTIQVQKFTNEILVKKEDIQKDNLTKQFIEILIKDILTSNPKLEFDKHER